jgi:hypothetical protein
VTATHSHRSAEPTEDEVQRIARQDPAGLDADGVRPLKAYAGLVGAYAATLAGTVTVLTRRGRLPERIPWGDLALGAMATSVLSRRITKDRVTSPLRAPFTKPEGAGGPGEVVESPRAPTGARRAVGELLSCPFCMSQWIATSMVVGLVVAPRQTRMVASILTVVGASDQIQFARARLEHAAEK